MLSYTPIRPGETVDRIEMLDSGGSDDPLWVAWISERWKESSLSGSEWRFSWLGRWRRGVRPFRDPHITPDEAGVYFLGHDLTNAAARAAFHATTIPMLDETHRRVHVVLFRKGRKLAVRVYDDALVALASLPWFILIWEEETAVRPSERHPWKECAQPGCTASPVVHCRMLKLYDRAGRELAPGQVYGTPMRAFCERHRHRGDSRRDDCDANYVVVEN